MDLIHSDVRQAFSFRENKGTLLRHLLSEVGNCLSAFSPKS